MFHAKKNIKYMKGLKLLGERWPERRKKHRSNIQSRTSEIYVKNSNRKNHGTARKSIIFERNYRKKRENLTVTLYL